MKVEINQTHKEKILLKYLEAATIFRRYGITSLEQKTIVLALCSRYLSEGHISGFTTFVWRGEHKTVKRTIRKLKKGLDNIFHVKEDGSLALTTALMSLVTDITTLLDEEELKYVGEYLDLLGLLHPKGKSTWTILATLRYLHPTISDAETLRKSGLGISASAVSQIRNSAEYPTTSFLIETIGRWIKGDITVASDRVNERPISTSKLEIYMGDSECPVYTRNLILDDNEKIEVKTRSTKDGVKIHIRKNSK